MTKKNRYFPKMSLWEKIAVLLNLCPKNNFKKRKFSPFDEKSNAFLKNVLAPTFRELFQKNRFWSLVIRYNHRYSTFLEQVATSFFHVNDVPQIEHFKKLRSVSLNWPFMWSSPENHWFCMIFRGCFGDNRFDALCEQAAVIKISLCCSA